MFSDNKINLLVKFEKLGEVGGWMLEIPFTGQLGMVWVRAKFSGIVGWAFNVGGLGKLGISGVAEAMCERGNEECKL